MKRTALARSTKPPLPEDRLEALRSNAGRGGQPYWVPEENGCWRWQGHLAKKTGYATFGYGVEGTRYATPAHRAVYEALVGPIPQGLTIDHLCRNTGCVNPEHLEPVTMAENLRRGESPSALNGRKTVCKRGHDLVPRPGTDKWRLCAICREENQRKRRARKPKASTLKNRATTLHSAYVRARDGGCVRCRVNGAVPSSKLECSHLVSRRYTATRTYEWNACALCSSCHRFLTEHPNEAVAWNYYWCATFAPLSYDELIQKAYEGKDRVMRAEFWAGEIERLSRLLEEVNQT